MLREQTVFIFVTTKLLDLIFDGELKRREMLPSINPKY